MFDRLEEIYVQFIKVGPAYTKQLLVDRALGQFKRTKLYQQICIEWGNIDTKIKD